MDGIPYLKKHSVTLYQTILFLNPSIPNPAFSVLAHRTCRALQSTPALNMAGIALSVAHQN